MRKTYTTAKEIEQQIEVTTASMDNTLKYDDNATGNIKNSEKKSSTPKDKIKKK